LRTIEEIYKDMDVLVEQIDGEDAIEEVKVEFVPFEKNTNVLMESEDIESYLTKYDEISKENKAPLVCFNSEKMEDLQSYITNNDISFDDLKTETINASCEALKFVIYEAEEEEY